jgi:2-oxoglutarate ferredoxin oxidoreductase subunit beta
VALGIIRDVKAPSYDESVYAQIEEVRAKKQDRTLEEMLMKTSDTWEIK